MTNIPEETKEYEDVAEINIGSAEQLTKTSNESASQYETVDAIQVVPKATTDYEDVSEINSAQTETLTHAIQREDQITTKPPVKLDCEYDDINNDGSKISSKKASLVRKIYILKTQNFLFESIKKINKTEPLANLHC